MSDREFEPPSTASDAYASRMTALTDQRWKRVLSVQAPYRWNLRRMHPGFVLDVGCGIGRNLAHLVGHAVGVDHNERCVETARERGYIAFTSQDFATSEYAQPSTFDSILLSHVLEHMTEAEALSVIGQYLPFLKADGRLIVITPQELGQRSDPTHVRLVDFAASEAIAEALNFEVVTQRSFPFPRVFGSLFKYNEFVVVCEKRDAA